MKLTLPEYAKRFYSPDSAPSVKTLRKRAARTLKGYTSNCLPYPVTKEGRSYYVNIATPRTSHPLVASVLNG